MKYSDKHIAVMEAYDKAFNQLPLPMMVTHERHMEVLQLHLDLGYPVPADFVWIPGLPDEIDL